MPMVRESRARAYVKRALAAPFSPFAVRAIAAANVLACAFTVASFVYFWAATEALSLCAGLAVGWIALGVTGFGGHALFTAYVSRTALVEGRFPFWWEAAAPPGGEPSQSRRRTGSAASSGAATPPSGGSSTPTRRMGRGSSQRPQRTVFITPVQDDPAAYMPLLEPLDVNTEGPVLLAVTGKPGVGGRGAEGGQGVSPEELAARLEAVARHACTPARVYHVLRVAGAVLVVLSVAVIWSAAMVRVWLGSATVRPDLGLLRLPGLTNPVAVTYSPQGVASIVTDVVGAQDGDAGTAEADLWYAQGAVHARDRLWQIEFQRRVATGTLAELVGAPGTGTDKLFRVLGFAQAAVRDAALLANTSAQAYGALQRYCDGVNDFVAAGTGLKTGSPKPADAGDWAATYALGYVPLEMRLLGVEEWAAYTPAHALAWAKVTAWGLAGNLDVELSRYNLLINRKLSPDRIDELIPPFNTTRFPTVLSPADVGLGGEVGGRASPPTLLPASLHADIAALLAGGALSPPPLPRLNDRFAHALVEAEAAAGAALSRAGEREGGAGVGDGAAAWPLSTLLGRAPLPLRAMAGLADAALALGRWAGAWAGVGTQCTSGSTPSRESSTVSSFTLPPARLRSGVRRPGASNNWVIHGNHTVSGLPLLANDPHLQLLAPSLWYLNHLQSANAGINVVGASFIGSPGVVIGRNARLAWAVTNTGVDVQDTYILNTTRDASGATYVWDGVPLPFTIRTETIHVKGEADVVLPVRVSRYGPVITDFGVYTGYGPAPLSLRWVQSDPSIQDTLMAAVYSLQTAHDWESFRDALRLWTGPSQNFMYADVEGHIGYQMPGLIPVRNGSAGHTGAYPVPGTTPDYDWLTFHPFDTLPRTCDPPEGFLVSANNAVVPPSYPVFLTSDWDETDGYRAARIRQRILARMNGTDGGDPTSPSSRLLDPGFLATVQADVWSGFADAVLCKDGPASRVAPDAFGTPHGKGLRDRLVRWCDSPLVGSVLDVGSEEATLWAALFVRLASLGTESTGTDWWPNAEYLLRAFEKDGEAGGTDPACKQRGDTCLGALADMFDDVAAQFHLNQDGSGGEGEVFGWGTSPALHSAWMQHQVLHSTPLGCAADRTVQHGGDDFTVNVGGFDLSSPAYVQTHGPSFRQIVDLADGAAGWGPPSNDTRRVEGVRSLYVQPMGQRADPLDPSYASMTALWADPGEGRGYVYMGPGVGSQVSGPPDTLRITPVI